MTLYSPQANGSFLPFDVGALIVQPVTTESIATRISTVVKTGAQTFRIPIVSADPTAAWTAEGAEIAPSDPTLTELIVTPKKLAGLTVISNELAHDSSPEAAKVVGDGLARDLARKIDAAFFAATTVNGPSGVKSLTTTVVSAGGNWSNVDPFTEAQYAAEGAGTTITAFVANPADALLLAKLKAATASNLNLLQPDPTQAGRRTIGGVPLYISTAVTVGEVWAIPQDRAFVVIREDATVTADSSVFFTSDRVAVRATLRVGFAFPQPLGLVKITKV
ncbi:phage major capsid protein [Nakamurella antarctica]|uniref:Phage major capsid protein n=1 Tax=Nakamurella antarctica TaxID=1902245 RepID=A0A3G8ZNK4_9ACTN|nr:phage major capsid protein [Nakamurella antarctica]AZI58387.1 phage major capsid protein [Nakamurella antarctica]